MILLTKLEQIAEEKRYLSRIQFGFSDGVGCIGASYVISESINQLLEKESKDFGYFLDVQKAFDTLQGSRQGKIRVPSLYKVFIH